MANLSKSNKGGQRVGLPTPKSSVVGMQEVPDPPASRSREKYGRIWEQIGELKPGKALRVDFESSKQALYVRGILRKKAKAEGVFLSSSRTADDLTFYFWLEKNS